ncbi:unnamed protein product, partial [Ixodes persulcatus]
FRFHSQAHPNPSVNWSAGLLGTLRIPNIMDNEVPNKPLDFYTCTFKKSKLDRFLGSDNQDEYFTTTQRLCIVYEILQTAQYGKRRKAQIGIDRLIEEEVYTAAFPLHEGDYRKPPNPVLPHCLNRRQVLYEYWARWSCWYKYQPLDHIREYFGEKIGIYFAWLGFYTGWLLPAAVVGFLVFLYGIFTIGEDGPTVICKKRLSSVNIKKKKEREKQQMSGMCIFLNSNLGFDIKLGPQLFDVFLFFCFILYMATCFGPNNNRAPDLFTSELLEHQTIRVADAGSIDPLVALASLSVVSVPSCVLSTPQVLALWVRVAPSKQKHTSPSRLLIALATNKRNCLRSKQACGTSSWRRIAEVVAHFDASRILNPQLIYHLTRIGLASTRARQHARLALKCDVLASNRFPKARFNAAVAWCTVTIFEAQHLFYTLEPLKELRLEYSAAPFPDLLVGAAILVLSAKQTQQSKYLLAFCSKLKAWWHRQKTKLVYRETLSRWEEDYQLIQNEGLFQEYLEMVLQFGFITIFVAAFPLAPLFALLNNWVEIRLDAQKFVCETRRSVPERAQNIGIWFSILELLSRIAVISNVSVL